MVSIETEAEFEFVQDLLKKNLNVSGPEPWCRRQNNSVCLALNLNRHGGHFRWGQGRPLVISPPWPPSLEEYGDCVTWVLSRDETGYSGVWRQVDCNVTDRYLVICETEKFIKYHKFFLMSSSEFVEYNNAIVSVAANSGNDEFNNLHYSPRFNCQDSSSKRIAYSSVCDDICDCPNGRDELICSTQTDMVGKESEKIYTSSESRLQETTNCNTSYGRNEETKFRCDNFSQLVSDMCTPNVDLRWNEVTNTEPAKCWFDTVTCGKDSVHFEKIGSNQTNVCGVAPKCLYIKSSEGVIGCHNMTHLQNCTRYKCPSCFSKCPLSYCIPETYVNDGTQDCPQGEDENNLFKCFNTSQYVFLENVCDGFKDCPRGDDEMNCNVECPSGVICVAGTATVPGLYYTSFILGSLFIDDSIRLLLVDDFRSVKVVTFHTNTFSKLIELQCANLYLDDFTFLTITENNTILFADFSYSNLRQITSTGNFARMKRLKTLDLSYNDLLTTFNLSLPSLERLDLSHTSISSLISQNFNNMRNLRFLYLIGTKITNPNFIPINFVLSEFDITATHMKDIKNNYFNNLEITVFIKTSNHRLCCPQALGENTPPEKCSYDYNTISSCLDLIKDVGKRSLLWTIGVLALLGNSLALVYRMIWDRKVLRTVYGQFVSNLCISDMIMGFYLIIIGVADEVYRDNYFVREEEWQYGVVCQVAGFLSTLSSEVTTFFICLITLDRFLTLRFQTGKYRFTTRIKRASIILSWLLGFTLALVPVLYPEWGVFTSNSMCLAFPLDTAVSGGRYYSVALFLGLNLLLFVSIIVGQIFIFRSLSASRTASTFETVNNSRRTQEILVARQLSLVAVTNFLAWVPVQVMGTLALAGVKLDSDVYTWTAVFVLPLNSAFNPIVYSLPKLYGLFQSVKNWCRK
ncbi:G-protein coupled receptor GRL101-like [Physella acuta]|uniref:G-protein coupled receptor GRL101-like n=1 Tax=Physella acuta TaxID=109671 RepID=UPI0027DB9F88|nr:G-protein coupled receptor GRL101-like [Physella acuta]